MKRNKIYERREPTKDGKLYFIFCEGDKRETTYFYFFNRIASQIIIQIVPIEDGKNSPMGLYNNACQRLLKSEENPNPTYTINDEDEVWFIIDTDKWDNQIDTLRESVSHHQNWFVGQSNPSFEVWLYYHFRNEKPRNSIDNWKEYLNTIVSGGFDNRKHPIHIETAITNAENNYSTTNNILDDITTELFFLGQKILPLVKQDIDILLNQQNE
ncbi:MAG: RloB family protein [Saprospiraceae bacterium]